MSDGISAALFWSAGPMYLDWVFAVFLSHSWLAALAKQGAAGCIFGFAVHSCERVHISLKGHKRTCNCDVWAEQTPIVMSVRLLVGMFVCYYLTWTGGLT